MPRDSNWNTAAVFPVRKIENAPWSSSGSVSRSIVDEGSSIRTYRIVQSRIVSVVSPRKSNLTSPTASTSSLSNCDMIASALGCT